MSQSSNWVVNTNLIRCFKLLHFTFCSFLHCHVSNLSFCHSIVRFNKQLNFYCALEQPINTHVSKCNLLGSHLPFWSSASHSQKPQDPPFSTACFWLTGLWTLYVMSKKMRRAWLLRLSSAAQKISSGTSLQNLHVWYFIITEVYITCQLLI